jgi:transposase
MGWSGRAPAPPANKAGKGRQRQGARYVQIEALAGQDQACSRLMTVPGIGPIISGAMVAAIGTGDVFSKVIAEVEWTARRA